MTATNKRAEAVAANVERNGTKMPAIPSGMSAAAERVRGSL
jgi:hypothetical protein